MSKRVQIKLDDDKYKKLKEAKQEYGMTWKAMLIHSARKLDQGDY